MDGNDEAEEEAMETVNIDKLAQQLLDGAKKIIESGQELVPLAWPIYYDQSEPQVAVEMDHRDAEEKRYKYGMFFTVCKAHPGIQGAIWINDCRMKVLEGMTREEVPKFEDGEVSEDKRNPEALLLNVAMKGAKQYTSVNPYRRKKGKVVWDEPIITEEMEGFMVPDFGEVRAAS